MTDIINIVGQVAIGLGIIFGAICITGGIGYLYKKITGNELP